MKTNSQVVEAFMRQEPAKAGNLSSDGESLWSYGWWEMARWITTPVNPEDPAYNHEYQSELVIRRGRSYSSATGHHMSILNYAAGNPYWKSTPGIRLTDIPLDRSERSLERAIPRVDYPTRLLTAADWYVQTPTGRINEFAWEWNVDYAELKALIPIRRKVLKVLNRLNSDGLTRNWRGIISHRG